MNKGRKCKTVSFDLNDEIELGLMKYAESKGVFSRYMKRLIQKDKVGLSDIGIETVFVGLDEEGVSVGSNNIPDTPEDAASGFV